MNAVLGPQAGTSGATLGYQYEFTPGGPETYPLAGQTQAYPLRGAQTYPLAGDSQTYPLG